MRTSLRLAVVLAASSLARDALAIVHHARHDPYSKVGAVIPGVRQGPTAAPADAGTSSRFLIASFPVLKQVAYCHLPDNVWRPLVLGQVGRPEGVAVDAQNSRLYVSDPPNQAIWWYQLTIDPKGLLATSGQRHAAVEGVLAKWLTVNGVGDLYFTGRLNTSNTARNSVYRQAAADLALGNAKGAIEIYDRSNSGSPNPKVWNPTGIAVDSLFVYWGNGAAGMTHGSVVKGSRKNVGMLSQDRQLKALSVSAENVSGMAATGTHIFYLSPAGVHGVLKSAATPVSDPKLGLVAASPTVVGNAASHWQPTSIAWDGDNSLYFTDSTNGVVYALPALNVQAHNLTKYADAPGVHGIAVIGMTAARSSGTGPQAAAPGALGPAAALTAALLIVAHAAAPP